MGDGLVLSLGLSQSAVVQAQQTQAAATPCSECQSVSCGRNKSYRSLKMDRLAQAKHVL